MFFKLAPISLKIKIFEKIHTKSVKILLKKSTLHAFLVILSLGLKIEHLYWNCIGFFKTLKPPMSKILKKMTFFLVDMEFQTF